MHWVLKSIRKTPAMQSALNAIISLHLEQYPSLLLPDLYKLIFQAAMGSEHAVTDPDHAERRLKSEAEALAEVSVALPLTDPVSPDHRLVRVHLQPYLARGGHFSDLARAFIKTSHVFKSSVHRLETYWQWAATMAHRDGFPFSTAQLAGFGEKQRKLDYPAVHHSTQYRRLYRPAYRVVLMDLIELPSG